jgi:hypothetical protein
VEYADGVPMLVVCCNVLFIDTPSEGTLEMSLTALRFA